MRGAEMHAGRRQPRGDGSRGQNDAISRPKNAKDLEQTPEATRSKQS